MRNLISQSLYKVAKKYLNLTNTGHGRIYMRGTRMSPLKWAKMIKEKKSEYL
jgi:hypothetical protein